MKTFTEEDFKVGSIIIWKNNKISKKRMTLIMSVKDRMVILDKNPLVQYQYQENGTLFTIDTLVYWQQKNIQFGSTWTFIEDII